MSTVMFNIGAVLVSTDIGTNYHKVGGLKQTNKWSQFSRSGDQSQSVDGVHSLWGLVETVVLASSSIWWLFAFPGLWLPLSLFTWLSFHVSPLSAHLVKILVIGFRSHLDNPGWSSLLKILKLITSTKSFIPNKVTVTGFRDWDMHICLGTTIQPIPDAKVCYCGKMVSRKISFWTVLCSVALSGIHILGKWVTLM